MAAVPRRTVESDDEWKDSARTFRQQIMEQPGAGADRLPQPVRATTSTQAQERDGLADATGVSSSTPSQGRGGRMLSLLY
jgi:hypothetical protein